MGQQIEVPNIGVVEFPDSMNDDQIKSVIRRKSGAAAISANPPALKPFQLNMEEHNIFDDPNTVGKPSRGIAPAGKLSGLPFVNPHEPSYREATGDIALAGAPLAALSTPAAVAKGVVGSALGAPVARKAAELLGAGPTLKDFAETGGGVVGGMASQAELPSVTPNAKAKMFELSKTAGKELVSRVPLAGRVVQRPSVFDWVNAAKAKAPETPRPVYPSEPQGPQIPFELQQAAPLRHLPETGAKPASVTGEALGTLSKPKEFTLQDKPGAQPIPKSVASKALDSSLREAVGNKPVQPGVALKDQMKPVPEGHTPVESSAVRSFKYDADQKEMHVHTPDGITYVFGDVTPEQMQAFQNAPSKGKAWKVIRDSSPLVAKVLKSGERIPVKPSGMRTFGPDGEIAPGDDLTEALKKSLTSAGAGKQFR